MKKISCFVFLLACLCAHINRAQVMAWDTAHLGGFGTNNAYITALKEFNGKLWAGAGRYGNSGSSMLQASSNGFIWTQFAPYTAVMDPNDEEVSCMFPYSGQMFFGSTNYAAGTTSGGFYVTDGSSCSAVPAPSFTTTPLYEYQRVSAITVFPGTGTNDSVYVAWTNYLNGAEIWKTSVSSPGTWVLSYELPDSIGCVQGMTVYNGKIYAATTLAHIFESGNGITWTENAQAANGFSNNDNYDFTTLYAHNGYLFTSTYNYITGGEIWRTNDGINWTQSVINGVNVSGIYSANDFRAYNGVLWAGLYTDYFGALAPNSGGTPHVMGGSAGPVIISSSDDGATFTRRSDNNIDNEFNNNGGYYLEVYNNSIYAGGGNNTDGGRIYWKCFSPGSIYSNTTTYDTTCVGMTPTFFWNGDGATNWVWHDNGAFVALAQNTSITFTTPGTHTIEVIVNNYSCSDTASGVIFVNPAFTIDSVTAPAVACPGTNMTLTAYTSGGTAPISYGWMDGAMPIGTTQSITLPAAGTSSMSVTASDYYGCVDTDAPPIVIIPGGSTDLYGTISYSSGSITSGNIYVVAQGTSSALYDTVIVAPITAAGDYSIPFFAAGNYYIRAEANSGNYPTLVNTYFGDHYLWDSAIVVSHGCTQTDTFNIFMNELPGIPGPGSIEGYVYEGIGFGQKIIPGFGVMTNVIPGVPVKVGKNPSGTIVAQTITDATGHYQVTGLPYDNYRIYTDIPGYPMDSSYLVTLNAGSDSLVNLDYFVDSNSVYIDLTTAAHLPSKAAAYLNTYPNPAKENAVIAFNVKDNSLVKFELYNLQGEKIAVLLNRRFEEGNYTEIINFDQYGITGGTYMIKAIINNNQHLIKLVVIR